ncbi:MAG: primosomal protein N' [Candidatus Izimaplasma sp.]|nr:primosomal protein N' [Candidatus Izimaplasma bacterium]
MIARVLVDVKAKKVDKMYDYLIPDKYLGLLKVGSRVVVPFNHRQVMGYCLEISTKSEYKDKLKSISRIFDIEPYLNEELISLAKDLSYETGYLLLSVLETILPAALKVMYKPKIKLLDKANLNKKLVDLFKEETEVLLDNIDEKLLDVILEEIKKNHLKQVYEIKKRNKPITKRYAKLLVESKTELTDKQTLVFNYLNKRKTKSDIINIIIHKLNITVSVLKTMEKHGYIKIYEKEVYRDVSTYFKGENKIIELNPEQKLALDKIRNNYGKSNTMLLHGVTGSGKTEIYIKAIEEVIEKNQSVILLVPEISLTPMMISRFKSKFRDNVATIHSGLSSMEKYDEWRRIIRGEAKIVIGARSACFAPLKNIGLMIVDESHETSYKQNENLPYYAIDILKRRAKNHDSLLILGSATPNIESYARVSRNHYELISLKARALNSKMPEIKVVNMLEEFKSGNKKDMSQALIDGIQKRLDKDEQVILLINRRGYANFMICRECGHVYKCKNCDISLTYHKHSNSLKCHYCSYELAIPKQCEQCGSENLEFMGSGTQKIQDELTETFPDASIFRMDTDTTRKKYAHEKLLHSFQESGDILIGTQMIAKGLDFPRVTLVGIIQADGNLFVPDFRAPEKTFQLIMQVSGRSGRRDELGEVIIQAYNPDHYAIRYAYENDYIGFYEHEMRLRRIARYAPFYFLIELTITGASINKVMIYGINIVKEIRRELNETSIILGPSSEVRKIKNRFSTTILVKYKEEPNIIEIVREVLKKYENRDVLIRVDRFPGVG